MKRRAGPSFSFSSLREEYPLRRSRGRRVSTSDATTVRWSGRARGYLFEVIVEQDRLRRPLTQHPLR